jgi:hypothetical protein
LSTWHLQTWQYTNSQHYERWKDGWRDGRIGNTPTVSTMKDGKMDGEMEELQLKGQRAL